MPSTRSRHLLRELRTQALGLTALVVIASTGTAYAVAARNSVVSTSIKDGEVRSADLATGAVDARRLATGAAGPAQVADSSLGSADVGDGGLAGSDLAPGAVGPAEVTGLTGQDLAGGSLTGAQVDESTLGRVPTSDLGGSGRYDLDGSCDPESTVYQPCASIAPISLAAFGRILMIASVQGATESGSDSMVGTCYLELNGQAVPGSAVLFDDNDSGDSSTVVSSGPLVAVSGVLPPGNALAAVVCNQAATGAITYPRVRLSTVVLSAG